MGSFDEHCSKSPVTSVRTASVDPDRDADPYAPSPFALALAAWVIFFSCAVLVVAAYELSQSSFWQAAPVFLQRALK